MECKKSDECEIIEDFESMAHDKITGQNTPCCSPLGPAATQQTMGTVSPLQSSTNTPHNSPIISSLSTMPPISDNVVINYPYGH